jgi:hypothetical protein
MRPASAQDGNVAYEKERAAASMAEHDFGKRGWLMFLLRVSHG